MRPCIRPYVLVELKSNIERQQINPKSGFVFVVVAYDISSNKKRYYLNKLLKSYGFRVQRSVFEAQTTKEKLEEMCGKLNRFFKEETEDSLRVYCISFGGRLVTFGRNEIDCPIGTTDEPIVI